MLQQALSNSVSDIQSLTRVQSIQVLFDPSDANITDRALLAQVQDGARGASATLQHHVSNECTVGVALPGMTLHPH